MKVVAKRGGQPKFTRELGETICERLATGESLNQICRDSAIGVHEATVRGWAREQKWSSVEFVTNYARAREAGLDRMAEELIEIADDGSNDWMKRETDRGTITVLDAEHVQRSKLRIDARKWYLSKLAPKRYGDRVIHAGDENDPIQLVVNAVGLTTRKPTALGDGREED